MIFTREKFFIALIFFALKLSFLQAQCTGQRDVLLNPGNWIASNSGGTGVTNIIDGNLADNNYWTSTATNQSVTIDLGSAQNIGGVVYYPHTSNNVTGYTIQTSLNGSIWATAATGTISTATASGVPTSINFTTVSTRYLRMIASNSGARIAELLPVIVGSCAAYPTLDGANVWKFNSGGETSSTLKPNLTLDNNWEVAYITNPGGFNNQGWTINSIYNYSSTANLNFYPAILVNRNGAWTAGGSNYRWIGATRNRADVLPLPTSTNVDGQGAQNTYFYRYRFNIPNQAVANNLNLKFRLWSDNVVIRLFVNGINQNITPGGEHSSTGKDVVISSGFVVGTNELMVQIYSEPTEAGFMIQNMTYFLGHDFGDAPQSYGTSVAPSHIIETLANNTSRTVYMGTNNVDAENSGTASIEADSDDLTGVNDEDGIVSFPIIMSTAISNYSVNVTATNNSGADAYVVGWIDWNQNGTFDTGERVVSTVIATGSNNVIRTLSWSGQTYANTNSITYARFRISSDSSFNTAATPISHAKNGEVEDYMITLSNACARKDQDILLNPGTWVASANGGTGATNIINGNIADNSYWQSAAANQYVQIDLGSEQTLAGLVYYPFIDNMVTGYTIETSVNNTTWVTRTSGTMPASTGNTAVPVNLQFLSSFPARYIRFTAANSGARISELLPIVCNNKANYPTLSCNNVWRLNSGTLTNSSVKPNFDLDSNWEVAWLNNGSETTSSIHNYNSTTTANFFPAIVIQNHPAWIVPGTPSNHKWISATRSGYDVILTTENPNTYFYRYRFNVTDALFLNTIKLRLNMYVDNTVVRIFVNGIDQNITPGGTFTAGNQVAAILSNNFQLGENEIMIQTFSRPTHQGFLVQNVTSCSGVDFGDAPQTFGTINAPAHNVETAYPQGTAQLLKMGANNTDTETTGVASESADADDLSGVDDEDSVLAFPTINSNTVSSYTINVSNVTNNSGSTAYIVSWLDWNQNGIFDAGEKAVSNAIANGSTNITVPVTWTNQTFADLRGYTFVRFRISSQTNFNTLATPISFANDGEVEDYYFRIKGCIKPGIAFNPSEEPTGYTNTGILTKGQITVTNWPESMPNGYLVIDSSNKGMVVTHMTTAQRNLLSPLEGMLIYNTDVDCVQLYRGTNPGTNPSKTGWNCIERTCNE